MLPAVSRNAIVFSVSVTSALYPSSKSAFRLVTLVVEVTTRGAVPTATVEVNRDAVAVPVTPNEVSVPTDVMFGCAAVVRLPPYVVATTLPLNVVAVIEFAA